MNTWAQARGFLLAAMATTMALAAQSLVSLGGQGPEARLKLLEIVRMGGKIYAAIPDKYGDRLQGQWWSVGGYLAGCHVKEIARDSVVLTERQSGREITLHLAATEGSEAEDPAQRRKEWINSEGNPMYFRPFRLPSEVTDGWANFSEADRSDVAPGSSKVALIFA